MRKPEGLSFYKRLQINRFFSVNPSTNGLSISVGIPGARLIVPIITFIDRPAMVNVQKYGIRYRRYLVDGYSLLDEAKIAAEHDTAAAALLYRKAQRHASEEMMAEVYLGKGYTGRQSYRTIGDLVDPKEYVKLGAIMRGDYARFVETIEELRKKGKK